MKEQAISEMRKQTILVVEDSDSQRVAQQMAFENRGFSVRGAGNVREAREVINELGERLAVMVLDMRLEDPAAQGVTGADLGLEVRDENPQRVPEFIILSAYSLLEYYKLAVRLGVAAYLSKEDTKTEQLIRHVRALLIRRNLSVDDPYVSEQIAQIAEKSQWLSEAAARFCCEVLSPVLTVFLGAPHVILINDGRSIRVCHGGEDICQELRSLYEKLERVIQGRVNSDGPWIVNHNMLLEIMGSDSLKSGWMKTILGAAFLALPFEREIRISIGILPSNQPLAEDPKELAIILSQYLQRSVLGPLLSTLEQCISFKAKREARLLAHTCNYIAEEQLAILSDAVNFEEMPTNSESFRQLISLSETLRDTGQTLMLLESGYSKTTTETIGMRDLIRAVIEDLDIQLLSERASINGDCSVVASRDDVFIAISRILQWFAHRLAEYSSGEVHITCEESGEIAFEDRNPRLSAGLRQRLFSPFAQPIPGAGKEAEGAGLHFPLYLAKTLIELKHGGLLEDRSDDLPGSLGHKFVMRFPASSASDQ